MDVNAHLQLRYEGRGRWTLYCSRQGRWTRYPELEPCQPIDMIIDEIEADPMCIFWG